MTDWLDEPRPAHPVLDALMRDALDRLTVISQGKAALLADVVTTSKPDSGYGPESTHDFDLERMTRTFNATTTHRQRLTQIHAAQQLLRQQRYAPDRKYVRGTKEWRQAIATDTRPNQTVAYVYDVSERSLANYRREFKVARTNGRPRNLQAPSTAGNLHSVGGRSTR